MANTIAETGNWNVGDVFELDRTIYVVVEVGVYALLCGVAERPPGLVRTGESCLVSCGKLHKANKISVSVPVAKKYQQHDKT